MTDFKKTSSTTLPVTDSAAIPLSALRVGEQGIVTQIVGGRGLLGRMTSLGFTPGAMITILQNFGHGPLIARVRSARIALGRGEAGHVFVRKGDA